MLLERGCEFGLHAGFEIERKGHGAPGGAHLRPCPGKSAKELLAIHRRGKTRGANLEKREAHRIFMSLDIGVGAHPLLMQDSPGPGYLILRIPGPRHDLGEDAGVETVETTPPGEIAGP